MTDLKTKKILIMATDGFEQSELFTPLEKLRGMGATVDVASIKTGPIKGWDTDEWGKSVDATRTIAEIEAKDYDAIVLPGGQINPDKLRVEPAAIALIKAFAAAAKPIAAICHAPWLLIEAGLVSGKRMTSYKSIRTDLSNAGATVVDEAAVVDGNFITSRQPGDLDAFVDAIARAVEG